jgi:hypothetical protein
MVEMRRRYSSRRTGMGLSRRKRGSHVVAAWASIRMASTNARNRSGSTV